MVKHSSGSSRPDAGSASPEGAYHLPVLVDEALEALAPAARGEVMDGTVGGGGHARALLERYPECRLLAVDRDPEALERARKELAPFGDRVRFVQARFDEAAEGAGIAGPTLSGALLDLGISSRQIDRPERGFTFQADDAPLDMRMGGKGSHDPTAAAILNQGDEDELLRIFREYGEEPRARRLVREVLRRREEGPFQTAIHLVEAMTRAFGHPPAPGDKARIFQALRIAVNQELDSLDRGLPLIRDALLPGGVMVVISYHSLEDRRVKNAFREWSRDCVCPPKLPICTCRGRRLGDLLTRKPIRPGDDEVRTNPRSRSARLRAWRKAA
jgi:16S rRNA (cytosine1402-N4)-methyltransferase